MMRGQIESGIEAIDRALALAPAEAEYHLHRGNLLYRLGRFDEAAAAFDRAASLDPENPAPQALAAHGLFLTAAGFARPWRSAAS